MTHRLSKRALLAVLVTIGLVSAVASPAAALPAVQTVNQPLAGTAAPITLFDTGLLVCDACVPDFLVSNHPESGAGVQLAADIGTHWTSDTQTKVSYDDSLLRQGSTLPTTDPFTSSNGSITATFSLDAFIGLVVRDDGVHWLKTTASISPHVSHDVTIPCNLPPAGGAPKVCTSPKASFTVASFPILPGVVSIDLNVTFDIQATVDGNGVTSLRKATVVTGNDITPDHNFTFSPTSDPNQSDSMFVACNQPAGQHLLDSFTSTGFQGNVAYSVGVGLDVVADITALPDVTVSFPLGNIGIGHTAIAMTAPDGTADLGPVLPDLQPPTADPGGGATHTYSGTEGAAVSFDGSASSDPNCGPPSLTWDFGDGSSTASGTSPSHTYTEEGTYNGVLTATNGAGLTSTTPFSVNVADAPLNATGRTIVAANPVSATVASFIDTDTTNTSGDSNQDPTDYTATINWGDGNTSAGTIVPNGIGFDITGTHLYSGANLGAQTLHIHVCDVGGACADATSNLTVFQFLNGGAFVIGNGSATVGAPVTFWGAHWSADNPLLNGPGAPPSFKGFGATTSSTPPTCGGTFTTGPGNSTAFGGSLPTYMGVLVANSVTKHGSNITGNVEHIVVVKTNPGYAPNPGHAGTGTEVANFC